MSGWLGRGRALVLCGMVLVGICLTSNGMELVSREDEDFTPLPRQSLADAKPMPDNHYCFMRPMKNNRWLGVALYAPSEKELVAHTFCIFKNGCILVDHEDLVKSPLPAPVSNTESYRESLAAWLWQQGAGKRTPTQVELVRSAEENRASIRLVDPQAIASPISIGNMYVSGLNEVSLVIDGAQSASFRLLNDQNKKVAVATNSTEKDNSFPFTDLHDFMCNALYRIARADQQATKQLNREAVRYSRMKSLLLGFGGFLAIRYALLPWCTGPSKELQFQFLDDYFALISDTRMGFAGVHDAIQFDWKRLQALKISPEAKNALLQLGWQVRIEELQELIENVCKPEIEAYFALPWYKRLKIWWFKS